MRFQRRGQPGMTLIEVLLVVAILGIVAGFGLPNLVGALQRNRARGTADILTTAMRDARARAIATGWIFRVVGFNDNNGGTSANRFRIEGKINAAALWPSSPWATTKPFQTSTQAGDRVISLPVEYPGNRLNVGDAGGLAQCGIANSFCIEYSPQGMLNAATSYQGPTGSLRVMDKGGNVARQVTAAVAGAVRVQCGSGAQWC